MATFIKKNKILQKWGLNLQIIKHEKARKQKGSIYGVPLGQYEVQLMKFHKDEVEPSFSSFGDTIEEALATMFMELASRQHEYLMNTLALSDEAYED